MTLNELRTMLTLMGWRRIISKKELYWESWSHNLDMLHLILDLTQSIHRKGRFAQDGNSIVDVYSYQGLFELAENADYEFERIQG